MYCRHCGAVIADGSNFCSYCGQAQAETTTSVSLMNKAVSTANADDKYSLVLISCGSCDKTTAGDLLEDVFGYTDAESSNLIRMAPVAVGERLTAAEAQTIAQMLSEYGIQVSITDGNNQYADLTAGATKSVFDNNGNLLAGAAAIIGALTIANRIRSYRRFKKPSLMERLFHLNYAPEPPAYRRRFRPRIDPVPAEPRRVIRKEPAPRAHTQPGRRPQGPGSHGSRPAGGGPGGRPEGGFRGGPGR